MKEQQELTGAQTLGELYVNISPELFFYVRTLIVALFFICGLMAINVMLGFFLAAIGFFLPSFILKRMREKRVKQLETQLVEGLELMGNALKSGLTLQQAMELLVKEFPAPVSQEFNRVLAENRLGVELTEALQNMSIRLESTIVAILVSGVGITKRCGGDLTQIFSNIAQTIREQATIEGKLDAVTAQGRFQGLILSIMPFALIVVLYFVDRSHVETLFGYQMGIYAVAAVFGMVMMAQAWINKILKIDV
jgi:tight adherence protein B